MDTNGPIQSSWVTWLIVIASLLIIGRLAMMIYRGLRRDPGNKK